MSATSNDSISTPPTLSKKQRKKMGAELSATMSSPGGKAFVWMLAFLWTVPTFGLLLSSFRPKDEIKSSGWWTFFVRPKLTVGNYKAVVDDPLLEMGKAFFTSLKIVIPATVISIAVALLAAYALSWMNFRGREWLFVFLVGLLVVPLQMGLVPMLKLFNLGAHLTIPGTERYITFFPKLGILRDSVVSVWIAHTCFGAPFCIFTLKNFVSAIPRELIEASRVDGAGHLTIFRKVVLPLSIPAIASLGIFQFIYIWNDFLIGKLFGGLERPPITAKLIQLVGSRGQDWPLLTSAAFVSSALPLAVFFALQKYFVRGLLAGSVKG